MSPGGAGVALFGQRRNVRTPVRAAIDPTTLPGVLRHPTARMLAASPKDPTSNIRSHVDQRGKGRSMPNRLAGATIPYLLQHGENPVDWWEWGDEAFAEARRRDVPVLLSVGYAACP